MGFSHVVGRMGGDVSASSWCATLGLVRGPVVSVVIALALVAGPACDGSTRISARADEAAPPGTFFAVRNLGTQIVEIDSNSGRVRRTVVDLRHEDPEAVASTGGLIDGLHLAADRRVLYYSRWSGEPSSVYQVALPDGDPERVVDGHGASVSPDGRRLAFIRRADLLIRDLASNDERVFDGLVGELGGVETAWANDSRRLAVEISGADVSGVEIVDTETGEIVALQPEGELAANYRVVSPRYRPSDGILSVVCCHTGEIVEGEAPHSMTLVLHNPTTGAEQTRMRLPFPARDTDWDAAGSHLIFTDGDRVHHYSDGQFRDVPRISDIDAVAW
jgi:hypothetical protein